MHKIVDQVKLLLSDPSIDHEKQLNYVGGQGRAGWAKGKKGEPKVFQNW